MLVAEGAHRVGGGLGAAFHAQLGEQRRHVILHRLLRQEHPLPDLPVRQPLPDQLQDPPLLPAQPRQRIPTRRHIPPPRPPPSTTPPAPAPTTAAPAAPVPPPPPRPAPGICFSTPPAPPAIIAS